MDRLHQHNRRRDRENFFKRLPLYVFGIALILAVSVYSQCRCPPPPLDISAIETLFCRPDVLVVESTLQSQFLGGLPRLVVILVP
mgnify:CR=1 FL=1